MGPTGTLGPTVRHQRRDPPRRKQTTQEPFASNETLDLKLRTGGSTATKSSAPHPCSHFHGSTVQIQCSQLTTWQVDAQWCTSAQIHSYFFAPRGTIDGLVRILALECSWDLFCELRDSEVHNLPNVSLKMPSLSCLCHWNFCYVSENNLGICCQGWVLANMYHLAVFSNLYKFLTDSATVTIYAEYCCHSNRHMERALSQPQSASHYHIVFLADCKGPLAKFSQVGSVLQWVRQMFKFLDT